MCLFPVAQGGSSPMMGPATEGRERMNSAVELPEDSNWS